MIAHAIPTEREVLRIRLIADADRVHLEHLRLLADAAESLAQNVNPCSPDCLGQDDELRVVVVNRWKPAS